MRLALRKILVVALSVGLAVSAPALSHAGMAPAAVPASHEMHDVPHYADLAVEREDDCPHARHGGANHHDDGVCKKCCAACLGASLIPSLPVSVEIGSVSRSLTLMQAPILSACDIPTEPGIPKPL